MRISQLLFLILFLPLLVQAQWNNDSSIAKKGYSLIPLPVFFVTPETGFAYGARAILTYRPKGDSLKSRPSQISSSVIYTVKKQLLINLPFNTFFKNGKYLLNGDLSYSNFYYNFFSIKELEPIKESFKYESPKFVMKGLVYSKNIHLYSGWRFHYENFVIKSKDGPRLNSGLIPGSSGSLSIGTGPVFLFDNRDYIFYPTKGFFTEIGATFFQKEFGSSIPFTRYNLDVVHYQKLYQNLIVANNLYFNYIPDIVPFNMASTLGGQRRMRGYFEGYFRDNNCLLYQPEFRYSFFDGLMGVVLFSSLGFLGDDSETIRFNHPKFALGTGLRLRISEKDKLNLRMDYAIGKNSSGFYITIGEAF